MYAASREITTTKTATERKMNGSFGRIAYTILFIRRTTANVSARAAATGYSAGLLVEGGWLTVGVGTNWDVPRYNVPAGLSTDGFRLRLSGYWMRHNGGRW